MKKICTVLFASFLAVCMFAQNPDIPIDFESTTLTYTWNDFGGGVGSVIDNPQSGGINTSAKVGQVVKNAGEVFGGTTLPLENPVDFGSNNAIKMKVLANRVDAPVLFKFEGPTPIEVSVNTTVANEWEELTFSFVGFTDFTFTAITIIYDLGVVGDGSADFTLHFDDIEYTTVEEDGVQIPVDFEDAELEYTWSDFGGGVATVIDNPQSGGINTSAKVGQMVKFAGEVFGGSTLALDVPVDFGDNSAIKMKVLANRVDAPVTFKFEGPTPVEVVANTTVANEWEELTFSFVGFTDFTFTGITIIYDLGVVGDGSADFTLLFDDIEYATLEGGVEIPINFEDPELDYAWSDFGGGVATVIDNPQSGGINTSAKVTQMVKNAGEVFGGSTLALGAPVDFGDNNAIKMKVFANRVDAPVTFKFEGPTPYEVVANTTVANEWEELTFSFAGFTDLTFTAVTIIYDLGVVGDGSADFTLLFDDIEYTTVELSGVQIPIDFEDAELEYTWSDFGGGVGSVIDNPQSGGINTSAKVGQVVKNAGEVFGGSTLALDAPVDFGENDAIKMKVFANRVDAPVTFKLEGPVPVEMVANTTVANEWEELTFSFAGLTDATYTAITIIYDNGVAGDGSADFTLLFDDIEYTTVMEEGGVEIPIDFEDAELEYTWSDFGGGVGSVIDNPQSGGINTSAKVGQVVKNAGEVFGGSTLALDAPVDFGENDAIKMKVFANRVDAPVTFKLEGPVPVEMVANTTVANEWEELTFSFAGLTDATYTAITIIYDNGVVGDGSADFTLLFDDIEYTTGVVEGGVEIPIDFEDAELEYTWSDFGGGVGSVIDNPQSGGINTSAKVGQVVKNAGEVFGGSTLALDAPVDFGDNNAIKMKVFANRVDAPVTFKLEGPTPIEVTANTTVANEWEELTFSFAGFTDLTFTAITIIYDLGVVGDGSADFTLLFDDIEYTTIEEESGVEIPIDFEDAELEYTWTDFAGGVATVIDNPQSGGINTSSKVGQMIKDAGEVFGGSTLALDAPVDFGDNNAIKMKVFANRVDAPVTFKLEGPTPIEVTANTTVANEWEELTFSFAGFTDLTFTAITIIYDLGVVGDGSADFTLLFDDIDYTTIEEESGVEIPIDFEDTELEYVWTDFAGGVGSVIDNPQSGGINTSAKVGQMVKFDGEVFGGSTLALGAPVDFGDNNAIKMKVFANRVDAPVTFKLEGPTPIEVTANTTVANEWEELTFSFAGLTGATYTAITIIYDLGVVGDGSADFTLLFDDIEYATLEQEGVQIPINFEDTELDYNWSDFGGGVATLIDNPQSGGINTSPTVVQMVKFAGEVFGGSTLALGGPIDFGEFTSISMDVFANRVDAPVTFKLEGPAPVEVVANTTVANEWEELVFDFDGVADFANGVYNGITIIYDLGVVGDGSEDFTILLDNIKFTGTTSVVDVKELDIEYFPNPVRDVMTINAQAQIKAVAVYNLNGQRLYFARPGDHTITLNLSNLPAGQYFVQIVIDGQLSTAKIVKQ